MQKKRGIVSHLIKIQMSLSPLKQKNNWEAKNQEAPESKGIPYQATFRNNGEDKELGSGQNSAKIEKKNFEDNQCEFSLIFHTEQPIKGYTPGTYADTITVNVQAE